MPNKLDYVKTPKPNESATVFSPSQFSKFIDKPHNWYREQILEEEGFTGNTSSVIGTIVHYIAETVAKGLSVDKEEIARYIAAKEPSEDYDPVVVEAMYPTMAEALVNGYVLENKNNYHATEESLITEIDKNCFLGGTIDVIQGSLQDAMIVDYKTYNNKIKPKAIPNYYKYQLLCYAAMAKANGYNVTRIRLVYVNRPIEGAISEKTGKRLKSYPSEVTVLTEELTEDDMKFIKSMLYLAVDSLEAAKDHPELVHVIFHDPRLKENK